MIKNSAPTYSRKKYDETHRIIALLPAGLIFLVGVPLTLITISPLIDAYFSLPTFTLKP